MQPKILLVDDNEDLLLVTQIILKGQGYETFLARNAAEAERKIQVHHPILALVDVGLGDANGADLCRRIRGDRNHQDIRFILMSGDDSWAGWREAADDFLPKPFDFNELIDKVHGQMFTEAIRAYGE